MGNDNSKNGDASAVEDDAGSSEAKAGEVSTKEQKNSSPSSPEHQPKQNPIQSLMKLKRKKPPPIPAFRRRKLSHAFHQFFDMSGNGCVDWEDFDLARQNVCRLNGWKPEMEVAITAEETFKNLWQLLQESADENKDGKITTEEWIQMWEEVSTKVNIHQLELELLHEKALAESAAEAAEFAAAAAAVNAASATTPIEENPSSASVSPALPPRSGAAPQSRGISLNNSLAARGTPSPAASPRVRHSISTTSPMPAPRLSPRQRKSLIGGVKLFGKSTPESRLKSIPWLAKFIDYKFSLFDRTRNGIIDVEEFEYVLSDFGVPGKEARQAFTLMTLNDEEKLDYFYFKKLLLQYYFSDDECSLGNFVTGKLTFEDDPS